MSMSLHCELPKIVAFDTFVCNSDRSLPNIFYNKIENKFYGIDHAAAFTDKCLSVLAIDRLKELESSGFFKNCDKRVIDGLKSYRGTLITLYEKITLSFVAENLKKHAGSMSNRAIWHTEAFNKNYEHTKKLIDVIEQISNKRCRG